MTEKKNILISLICFFLLISLSGCFNSEKEASGRDLTQIQANDTLVIGTMYGPSSYFSYRGETVGFDYELAEHFAKSIGTEIKIRLAYSQEELTTWLREGEIDIAAYNFVETKALKNEFKFVLPQDESHLVIIQRLNTKTITNVTELAGKKIHIKNNTIEQKRLETLNQEIGGGIEIIGVPDSLNTEDLIEQVANKEIDFTVDYFNKALLYKSYYHGLDCRLAIGFNQRNGWLISKNNKELIQNIEAWENLPSTDLLINQLYQKYWENSLYFSQKRIKIPKGAISPYDALFKKYAPEINWDWKLVAAIAFHESRFDPEQVSWAGAMGLMQLMPRTAASFGLNHSNAFNPEKNIEAGIQYIKSLNLSFRDISNKEERIKFILASYNSGPAHVFDARALAKKYGKDPNKWFGHVEDFLLKKSDPKYYNDPVVKHGRYRGKTTAAYVVNTLETYYKYQSRR